jgi:putative YhdH/YhfP family quinone oxidoreductase
MVYRSFEVRLDSLKKVIIEQKILSVSSLPKNDLLINVKNSAINHLDALICSGQYKGVKYPLCPGIDACGIVVSSKDPNFCEGDAVVVTGIEPNSPGGFGEYITAPASKTINLPLGLTVRSAAVLGSAGITAALALSNMLNAGIGDKRRIAVTGAESDIGAIATAIFSHLGYSVFAFINGDSSSKSYVSRMNVEKVSSIEELTASYDSCKDYTTPQYDGIFDTVGGKALAALLYRLEKNSTAVVASTRAEKLPELSATLFTNSGINLIGVNGINCDEKVKAKMWRFISSELITPYFDWLCSEIGVDEIPFFLPLVLDGSAKGRVVINHC